MQGNSSFYLFTLLKELFTMDRKKLKEQFPFLPDNIYITTDGTVIMKEDGGKERLIPIEYNNNGKAHILFDNGSRTFKVWIAPSVQTAFVGKIPNGFEAAQKDGNRSNCRLDNLKLQPKGRSSFEEYKLVEP